ncbi:hypothetical protein [Klebsiella michiganensis]|uniref:hypothetical protein n=1 Tax=Klebsiella michiganensis TaxID=1134687 RepID=UPI0012B9E2B8|nr:hypothetical protein [Klebsiella michiganensis]
MAHHIIPSRLKLAEHARNTFRIAAEEGQSIDMFKQPAAWAHIAYQLKAGDKIEVFAVDRTWYAEGIVTSVKQLAAKVEFVIHQQFGDVESETKEDGSPYFVKFRGQAKWSIIRREDGEVMEGNIQTKEEAASKMELLIKEV